MSVVLQAATTIAGGLLGDRQRKKDQAYNERMIREQNAYNAPDQIRARAEKAGFNPLLFVGPGVGQQGAAPQAVGGNYLGNAIADAGLLAAEALAKQPLKQKLNAYQAQNAKLAQKVQSLTLRPKVGGLYAERVVTPSIPQAVGRASTGGPARYAFDRLSDPVPLVDADGGGIAVPDPRLDRGSGIFLAGPHLGGYWESAPGWSNAERIEDEYGDVASWGYGVAKIASDVGHNIRRGTNAMGWTDPNTWGGLWPSGRKPSTKAPSGFHAYRAQKGTRIPSM